MEDRGGQEDELKKQLAQTPQQAQPNPPQQHLPWSCMNTDQGQLGTGAQHSNKTDQSAQGTRACSLEGEESSEKRNQLQEVRTSIRLRKQPEKMDTFYGQQIVCGGKSRKVEEKQVRSTKSLNIVHQNIRSLWGKCEELEIVLATELNNIEVLCFTEHWLNCNKVHAVNINNFMLANAFCRKNSDYGGSCIFVKLGIITKELNFLNNQGEEKSIEMSAVEIVKNGIIVICIYRSPDGQIGIFFNKLEMIMQN